MRLELIVALLLVPTIYVIAFLSVGIVEALDRRASRRAKKP